jgi:hypothetical protein
VSTTGTSRTPSPSAPAVERRAAVRHRLLRRCLVLPEGATGAASWHAIAHDISRIGIGLALPCPLRPGALLTVEPWGPGGARTVRARVVRCAPLEFVWLHGCELAEPLTEDQLRAWLSCPR